MMPFGGSTDVKEMTDAEVKEGAGNLDCQSSFLDYTTKGYTIELDGSEAVDGKDCYKLKVNKGGKITTNFIDKSSFLILKTTGKRTINGNEMDIEIAYSNYKKIDGVMVAHTLVRPEGEMNFEKVTINSTIDESIFKPGK
jgi:Ni,Fe-hydrogenase III large subunit